MCKQRRTQMLKCSKENKGENPLRGQIGPVKPQNIKNILERVITPQYNGEVL